MGFFAGMYAVPIQSLIAGPTTARIAGEEFSQHAGCNFIFLYGRPVHFCTGFVDPLFNVSPQYIFIVCGVIACCLLVA